MKRALMIMTLGAALAASGSAQAARVAAVPQTVTGMEFLYSDEGVFNLVAAPGWVTDIVLEAGETLVEANPIAAGDTARWVIGDTTSGEGAGRRVHVLVKPVQDGLSTNLVINTNRRTYHLDLRASERAFLSQVRWRYPAPMGAPTEAKASGAGLAPLVIAPPLVAPASKVAPDPARLNFGYRIRGAAHWRPARVFDDGTRTYVEFGPRASMTDLPPLFLVGPDGKTSELVNYQVEGRRIVVDRLFDQAQLRLGLKRWERRIRLERIAAKPETGR